MSNVVVGFIRTEGGYVQPAIHVPENVSGSKTDIFTYDEDTDSIISYTTDNEGMIDIETMFEDRAKTLSALYSLLDENQNIIVLYAAVNESVCDTAVIYGFNDSGECKAWTFDNDYKLVQVENLDYADGLFADVMAQEDMDSEEFSEYYQIYDAVNAVWIQ